MSPRDRHAHPDDPESGDAAPVGLDVTPRTGEHTSGGGHGRRWLAVGGVAVLVAALGVVVFNGLTDASTFYYDVDEAVERSDELGDQRFRMQGNVVPGSIESTATGVDFVLAFGDAEVPVVHRGDPPELFDVEIPVIIEGSFSGDRFDSDEILIKHDSTYEEEHDARLRRATEDADQRAGAAG